MKISTKSCENTNFTTFSTTIVVKKVVSLSQKVIDYQNIRFPTNLIFQDAENTKHCVSREEAIVGVPHLRMRSLKSQFFVRNRFQYDYYDENTSLT